MSQRQTTTVTLRALEGAPLADDRIREMVISTARAIAERTGVEIADLASTDRSITVALGAGRIEAFGFAAELRRLTTAWYRAKFSEPTLWGEANHDDDEYPEAWKRA